MHAGGDIINFWFVYHVIRVTEPSTDILQSEEFNPPLSDESANFFLISQQFGLPAKPVIKEEYCPEGCGTSQPVANV